MPATEPDHAQLKQAESPALIREIRLKDGLKRIREMLAGRGEPISPDDSNLLEELNYYFNKVMFRLSIVASCLKDTLKDPRTLPKADILIFEQDVELITEIGRLLFLVFRD
jgi:hypothetical protein